MIHPTFIQLVFTVLPAYYASLENTVIDGVPNCKNSPAESSESQENLIKVITAAPSNVPMHTARTFCGQFQ